MHALSPDTSWKHTQWQKKGKKGTNTGTGEWLWTGNGWSEVIVFTQERIPVWDRATGSKAAKLSDENTPCRWAFSGKTQMPWGRGVTQHTKRALPEYWHSHFSLAHSPIKYTGEWKAPPWENSSVQEKKTTDPERRVTVNADYPRVNPPDTKPPRASSQLLSVSWSYVNTLPRDSQIFDQYLMWKQKRND